MSRSSRRPGRTRPTPATPVALIALAASAAVLPAAAQDAPPPPLQHLATAVQVGPVAYRDPLGRVSPDGRWLAWTERDRLHVAPVEGGAVRVIGPGTATLRALAWLPDSRRVAVRERVFDRSRQEWWVYDREDGSRVRLWPGRRGDPGLDELDMLAWASDGSVAGVARDGAGTAVWRLGPDGGRATRVTVGERLSFPVWSPDGRLACLAWDGARQRVRFPCGEAVPAFDDQEAYGPLAFSPDGELLYYAAPGPDGFLDLWARPPDGGGARRLTRFARDAYAPSVGSDGRVVFKSQRYRVFLATAPAAGGPSEPLTTFQSETPTWSPDGREVAFTFGDWRHVTDDFHYPDIAQHIGLVTVDGAGPRDRPDRVVRRSYSEDQAMHWSPDGRWIVFHTHEGSDDVWIVPADGSAPARMISREGSETGWPRWSPDGRWVVFTSYRRDAGGGRRAHLFVIGVDPDTGDVREEQRRVEMPGFEHDVVHGEWGDGGETLVFEAAEAIGRKSLWRVPREGGRPTRFHAYASDQVHSGIGVSPDGRWVAYVDRAEDGFFQIFRVPVGGGEPERLTFDPTHKTQPAYAPTGDRIAFTVFDYRVDFWRVGGGRPGEGGGGG